MRIVRNVNATDGNFEDPVDSKALLSELEECRIFAYSVDSVTPGSSVIAMRLPVELSGQPLAVGIGVNTWERRDIEDSIKELLVSSVRKHFPDKKVSDERPSSLVSQVEYGVTRRSDLE
ncbi:MAG: hypothetical protein ACI4QS_07550 [Comamonas sp.]